MTATNAAGIDDRDVRAHRRVVAAAPPVNTPRPPSPAPPRDGATLTADRGDVDRHAADHLRLPVAALRRRRRELHRHRRRDRPDLHAHAPPTSATHVRVVVTATNAAGTATATTAADRRVAAAAAGQHRRPRDLRHAARRQHADRRPRHLDRHAADHVRLPVAALRRRPARTAPTSPARRATTYTLDARRRRQATIRVVVTATNAAGTATATSAATAGRRRPPPVEHAPPTISGTPRDGQTLTADHGTWTGTPPDHVAYQWQRCDATARLRRHRRRDGTHVHARRPPTSARPSASSSPRRTPPARRRHGREPTDVDPRAARRTRVAPPIPAPPRDGETLTADPGTWTGTAPINYAYQWQRCDADGTTASTSPAPTSRRTRSTRADVGHDVRVVVTATNAAGTATATSARDRRDRRGAAGQHRRRRRSPARPATADPDRRPGTWTGTAPIAYAYQWRRCDTAGANCIDIAGATGATYTLDGARRRRHDRASSSPRRTPPARRARRTPSRAATARRRSTRPRRRSPAPPATASADRRPRHLDRHADRSLRLPVAALRRRRRELHRHRGRDRATYTLDAADVGQAMRVLVTATNAAGATRRDTPPTRDVAARAPVNRPPPTISGTPRDGETLTADTRHLDRHRADRPRVPVAALRRDGASCIDIAGATHPPTRSPTTTSATSSS